MNPTFQAYKSTSHLTGWGESRVYLHEVEGTIPAKKLKAIANFATQTLTDAGFPVFKKVNVCEHDDGYFYVEFTNEKGAVMTVNAILLDAAGAPIVHHGVTVELP